MFCEPKWKERSEQTTLNSHVPYLQTNPNPDIILIGTSMFERFSVSEEGRWAWTQHGLDKLSVFNCGVGGDRIRNILYRLLELKILYRVERSPKQVVIMAGANDIEVEKEEVMVDGITKIINHVRNRFPETKIDLIGIFPRKGDKRKEELIYAKLSKYNEELKQYAKGEGINYHYFGSQFVDEKGLTISKYYVDNVHLSKEGYDIFAKELSNILL